MTTKATIAATAIICLLIGGAGGYFGRGLMRQNRAFGPTGNFQGRSGQNGQMPGGLPAGQAGGRVIGQVQSIADGRLTVKTPNNSSKIVLVNSTTTYQKMTNGSSEDVTTGTQVLIMGQQNPDGSTTATSIQIIPIK
ncbi:MAG: hypothetical protein A3D99_00875 [Candidatus Andersenbacteria bacterium RIFCSPHIGHO2_12_FULL_45_11]|uniref:DUF5666 domain-containing protein n=1 Tax=Candidatus Andersenbacteria bacterium RIFCSPHIGHO2_12_FULL_45_11 TaxID=1797281 RepID=A0A1G1X5E5_9BACT|nr:MAG: hypothetical protein A3D99_00875 [Candidatus Andersenbacteria bacterium RIFCSPHIGHO2_12_FULL_45_11]